MGQITLGQIQGALAILAPMAACVFWMFRLWFRFTKLEQSARHRQEDMAVVLMCLRECLTGMEAGTADVQSKKALEALNRYMDNRAAGL